MCSQVILLLILVNGLWKGGRCSRVHSRILGVESVLVVEREVEPQSIIILIHVELLCRFSGRPGGAQVCNCFCEVVVEGGWLSGGKG